MAGKCGREKKHRHGVKRTIVPPVPRIAKPYIYRKLTV